MKFALLLFILAYTVGSSSAAELNLINRWGIGSGAGIPHPLYNNRFNDRADSDFTFNFNARYNFSNENSITIGYTRLEFDHTPTSPRVYDALFIRRLSPDSNISPIVGFGAGVADIPNYNVDENLKLSLRAKIGIEYFVNSNVFFSASVDYHYINKMVGERRSLTIGEIHAIVPQLGVHYVFDN